MDRCGGGNGNSDISGDDGKNGGCGSGKDNGGNSTTVAVEAVGAKTRTAVTAEVGGTNNNQLKRQWKKWRWR